MMSYSETLWTLIRMSKGAYDYGVGMASKGVDCGGRMGDVWSSEVV